jgi:hypothetical protein
MAIFDMPHPADTDVEQPTNRRFGYTVGGILLGLFAVKWIIAGGPSPGWWVAAFAGCLLIALALTVPALLGLPNRAWTRLGNLLFTVVNPLVMLLIYSTTFIPIGTILKLRKHDPLSLRLDSDVGSYWVVRPDEQRSDMRNQF